LLYHYLKLFHLPNFHRDDWVASEYAEFQNLAGNFKDGVFVIAAISAFLRDHINLQQTNFEKWNLQLDAVRKMQHPELAFRLFLYGVMFYELVDSSVIFLNDPALRKFGYAESFPRGHIGIPLILSIPDNDSIAHLDSALKVILKEGQIDTTLFLNFLALSESNIRFEKTSFFQEVGTRSRTLEEKKLLYYSYLRWQDYDQAEKVFYGFGWDESKSEIPPSVLLELFKETIKSTNYQFLEKMLDTMIPYAFQSNAHDYSSSIDEIDSFFFVHTKDTEALRKSPEYQRLLKKYVVN
jgi:hypothetical protein